MTVWTLPRYFIWDTNIQCTAAQAFWKKLNISRHNRIMFLYCIVVVPIPGGCGWCGCRDKISFCKQSKFVPAQCPHCPPPMNVKIQIDKFKHAEIQFRHKMTIYPSKKFKIAYLYCAQFPFILTKYQNYFLWGLFINVYPTNYPSP